MRSRISIRGCVCPSVLPSHTSWISKKWTEFEQNSIRNIKLGYLKTIQRLFRDISETSTLADRQNASDVWTLSDLFKCKPIPKFPGGTLIEETASNLLQIWLWKLNTHQVHESMGRASAQVKRGRNYRGQGFSQMSILQRRLRIFHRTSKGMNDWCV